jgi:putative peptide zinc metalloprotease protein
VKRPRLIGSLGVLAGVLAFVFFVPLPHRVFCPVEIKARGATPVYVEVPGTLTAVAVQAGQRVQAGDLLARLESVDLDLQIAQLEQQRDEQASRLATLGRMSFTDSKALGEIPQMREALRAVEEQLAKRMQDSRSLTLLAPCDGWVLPPPERLAEPAGRSADRRLPGWTGTPLERKNVGCLLESRVLVCQIGDPRQLEAVLVLDQTDIELVSDGCRVEIKVNELPHHELDGAIESIAQMEMQHVPPHLSTQAGGELATQTDRAGQERPQSTAYQARVGLQDGDGLLRPGLGGRAKIHAAPCTLAQRMWRYFSHTFRFGT